jgi:hypothetical protein
MQQHYCAFRRMLIAAVLIITSNLAQSVSSDASGIERSTKVAAFASSTSILNYPRLANLSSFSASSNVADYLHTGMVVASNWAALGKLQQLKQQNPFIKVLVYQDSSSVPVVDFGTYTIFPGWWLTLAGTTLAMAVDSTSTQITVTNVLPIVNNLSTNPDIVVEGESMHVVSVSGNTLTVQRGYHSIAGSHAAGVRIAAHATNWPGTWMLNITSFCPPSPTGQTWESYLVQQMSSKLAMYPWDGIFVDVNNPSVNLLSSGQIDANDDNSADGGIGWAAGEAKLATDLHSSLPNAILIGNHGYYPGINGIEFEHYPYYTTDAVVGLDSYLAQNQNAGAVNILNPDTSDTGAINLPEMRAGLGSALMGDGFFDYDYGSTAHGQSWQFDEYDNGAGSSLVASVDPAQTALNIYPGTGIKFRSGDVVYVANSGRSVGREEMLVTAVSGDTLIVQRGYNGTAPSGHTALTKVVTQAQEDAGIGWLGQPITAAASQVLTSTDQITNGTFNNSIVPWSFASTRGALASVSQDQPNSVRVDVGSLTPTQGAWDVQLAQYGIHTLQNQTYTLSFRARSLASRPLGAVIAGQNPPYPIYRTVIYNLSPNWQTYTFTFSTPIPDTEKVLFAFAEATGTVWVADVHLQQGDSNFWRRDFTHGSVLLNLTSVPQSVRMSSGYYYIAGTQSPLLNSGLAATSVTVPPDDAILLVQKPQSYFIYQDVLAPGWADWPYHASPNLAVTSPVYSDNDAASFTLSGQWGEIAFHSAEPFNTSPYTALHFAAQAAQATSNLVAILRNGSTILGRVSLAGYGGQPVPGAWKIYNIPFSVINPAAAPVTDVIIQDQTGQPSSLAYYLDEVGFTS